MLRLTIHDRENGTTDTRYGSDHDLLQYLHERYPQTQEWSNIRLACQALTESDLYVASVDTYRESTSASFLPENYLDHSQADLPDPWPREGEKDDV